MNYNQGIAPIVAIIIGLIIGAAIIVGIVATQKKAPISDEPLFVPGEEQVTEKEPQIEEEEEQAPQFASECGLIITSPVPNQTVSFPLTIEGILQQGLIGGCYWGVFEGEGGHVGIIDQSGQAVSDTFIIQVTNWMTTAPQPIMITIPQLTSTPVSNQLTLVFSDNDPRDPPQAEPSQLVISVTLASVLSQIQSPPPNGSNGNTMTVQVFFLNSIFNPGFIDCNVVHPIVRTIPQTLAVGMASLEELIKGPTTTEETQGYSTSINDDITIQSFSISNGVAYVDLSQELQDTNTGLCAGQFIHAQIKETLLQFSTVNSVVISINGDVNFVQP